MIISTNGNSDKYGECEKCGIETTEIFHVFSFIDNRIDSFVCNECIAKQTKELRRWNIVNRSQSIESKERYLGQIYTKNGHSSQVEAEKELSAYLGIRDNQDFELVMPI